MFTTLWRLCKASIGAFERREVRWSGSLAPSELRDRYVLLHISSGLFPWITLCYHHLSLFKQFFQYCKQRNYCTTLIIFYKKPPARNCTVDDFSGKLKKSTGSDQEVNLKMRNFNFGYESQSISTNTALPTQTMFSLWLWPFL